MAATRAALRLGVRRRIASASVAELADDRVLDPPASVGDPDRFEEVAIGAARAVWLDRGRGGGVLAFAHGGSNVSGPSEQQWRYFARLCEEAGLAGVLLLHRLAPEHPYPAGVEDASALATALAEEGLRWALIGDSAGASLAVSLAVRLRDEGRPGPAAVSLVSPILDYTLSDPALDRQERRDPFLTLAPVRRATEAWLAGADPWDPGVSPLLGELAGLPPTQIIVGDRELVAIDARRMRDRLAEAGVELDYLEEPGGFHGYPLNPFIPEARVAIARQARFLTARLAP